MKIYLVLSFSEYYSNADNVKGVYANRGDAEEFMISLRKTRYWEYHYIVEKEMRL
jgi:hypothetical protein